MKVIQNFTFTKSCGSKISIEAESEARARAIFEKKYDCKKCDKKGKGGVSSK